MRSKDLWRFISLRIKKAAASAREHVTIEENINPLCDASKTQRNAVPFDYVVIDDFFSQEFHHEILAYVKSIKARGISETPNVNTFYPFKYVTGYLEKYGGYFYPPRFQENQFMDLFFSVRWNLYIEKLMGCLTNEFVSTTIHWHTPGNKDGWAHNDYQKVFFNKKDKLPNGLIAQSNTQNEFTDDAARSIAVIYYFGNDEWAQGDGGETAIFTEPKENPCNLIAPKSNRLLVMKISPRSFHAFVGNKTSRHAIVQWFHVDSSEAESEYGYI